MADPDQRAVGYRGDGRGPFPGVARPGLNPEAREEVGPERGARQERGRRGLHSGAAEQRAGVSVQRAVSRRGG